MAVLKLNWNVMDLRKICGYGLFSSTILAVLRVFFFQQKWPEFSMIVIHFYAQVFVSHLNEKHEYFRAGRAEHFETVYHKPSQCPKLVFPLRISLGLQGQIFTIQRSNAWHAQGDQFWPAACRSAVKKFIRKRCHAKCIYAKQTLIHDWRCMKIIQEWDISDPRSYEHY